MTFLIVVFKPLYLIVIEPRYIQLWIDRVAKNFHNIRFFLCSVNRIHINYCKATELIHSIARTFKTLIQPTTSECYEKQRSYIPHLMDYNITADDKTQQNKGGLHYACKVYTHTGTYTTYFSTLNYYTLTRLDIHHRYQ